MEEQKEFNNAIPCEFNLLNLPIELKELIVLQSVSSYADQYLDISDLCNLEQNLCAVVKGFPEYLNDNLAWSLVSKEFGTISGRRKLDKYFKYCLTLRLSILNIHAKKELLANITMDKQCSNLIIALLILSTLESKLKSFSEFKKVYKLLKKAINCRSIYFCRPIVDDAKFLADFHYSGIINFDPSQFSDTQLLKIFLDDRDEKQDNDIIFDIYEIIFCLKSELKNELLSRAANQEHFKKLYLETIIAQTIHSEDLNKLKTLLSRPSDINQKCTKNNFTPLMLAVVFEAEEIIEYLISENADCLVENTFGRNALYYAAASKNPRILALFEKKIMNLSISFYDILKIAILTENYELLNLIDQNNIPEFVAQLNRNLRELLLITAQKNRLCMLERLLTYGNENDKDFDQLFSFALQNHCFDVANFLITNISSNWINKGVVSFPFKIATEGDLSKMKLLINFGINVGIKNGSNITPRLIAERWGYTEMATVLQSWERSNIELNSAPASPKKKKKRCILS